MSALDKVTGFELFSLNWQHEVEINVFYKNDSKNAVKYFVMLKRFSMFV